ncbi:MAG: UbiD family decarboxylase [Anaerolineae bacterium]
MTLREFIERCDRLVHIDKPVSSHLEAAGIIAALDGSPVYFSNVDGGKRVLSGFCASRELIAGSLGTTSAELLILLAQAMKMPLAPPTASDGPCQEVVMEVPDLRRLPILKHLADDGGPYITAGVAVTHDPEYGRNVCYHRLMVMSEREAAVRVVEGRGTHTAWSRSDADLPIAIAIGCPLPVLLAAAMSPAKGVDEFAIANAIAPITLVPCRTVPLAVPAEAEIVIEGRLTHRMAPEGPFIDLTETWDGVREQPVLEVDCITHRRDPIYHAILPGLSEHKMLMGLPREPGIYNAVRAVCDVRNVKLTPGGMNWLHALVQIRKRHADDGPRAIRAAMDGHPSVKMVIVVDDDIPLDDQQRVEWAIATRVQAGRDVYVFPGQPSSSLDPSARQPKGQRGTTDKVGVDATIPWPDSDDPQVIEAEKARFRRIAYPKVELARYVGHRGAEAERT